MVFETCPSINSELKVKKEKTKIKCEKEAIEAIRR